MTDVYVYRQRLPKSFDECVMPDYEDDGYTIVIDDRLDDRQAERAYNHAIRHILHRDFEKYDVQEVELQAH